MPQTKHIRGIHKNAVYAAVMALRGAKVQSPELAAKLSTLHACMAKDTDWSVNEVRFCLLDYRDGNRSLATRIMTRKQAWELNKRLEGSGMAFAQITGY